ncbi:MAG: xylulokinase [Phycisphaerae bacterium]
MTTDRDHLLGIDVGTSGAKVLLADCVGRVIAVVTREYPLHTPRPLWCEQDPADWRNAATEAVRDVLVRTGVDGSRIAAIGLTGQMHGLVTLDARGQVIRPAILWNDQRTAAQCEQLTRQVGAKRVLELTGNPILPGFSAPKIAWLRENEPDALSRCAHVLLPKDFVRYCLTGEFISDVSDASGTSLLDVGRRAWSEEMLGAVGVPHHWLPALVESPHVCARVSASAAAELGIPAGTPVVGGAGDQAAQAIGAGIVAEGVASVTIGTSGVVFAATNTYRPEPRGRLHAFCHALPNQWHLMGVMLAAGASWRWFRDVLGEPERSRAIADGRDPYDALTELAASAPPICEGLLFLPYLSGERTPHADPHARGVFSGLTLRHDRAHLARAVLEGISFGLRDSLQLLRSVSIPIREIRASGGGARSAFWRQLLADIFAQPIVQTAASEGAAYGAALLAGIGIDCLSVDTIRVAAGTPVSISEPRQEIVAGYATAYERYRALYSALREHFRTTPP